MFYIVLYEGIKPARVFQKEDAKLNKLAMGETFCSESIVLEESRRIIGVAVIGDL